MYFTEEIFVERKILKAFHVNIRLEVKKKINNLNLLGGEGELYGH